MPDDDVVKTTDSNESSRLNEPLGYLDIFPTWRRVTRRMIVDGDEVRSRAANRFPEDVSRVDDRRVQSSDE